MNDPGPMRFVERVGDLHAVFERLFKRQRAALESRRERLAFQVLHHQVFDVSFAPHVVQRANVRMVETGDQARFTLEPFAGFRTLRSPGEQNLDSDNPAETRITRSIHLAHAAGPDGGEDLVRAETSARMEGHFDFRFRLLGPARPSVQRKCFGRADMLVRLPTATSLDSGFIASRVGASTNCRKMPLGNGTRQRSVVPAATNAKKLATWPAVGERIVLSQKSEELLMYLSEKGIRRERDSNPR